MKSFYWYCGIIGALFILTLIAAVVYTLIQPSKGPDNAGLVTLVALGGPMVSVWLIALGWVVTIFWRKYGLQDPTVTRNMFIIAIVVACMVIQAPFGVYKTFVSSNKTN